MSSMIQLRLYRLFSYAVEKKVSTLIGSFEISVILCNKRKAFGKLLWLGLEMQVISQVLKAVA